MKGTLLVIVGLSLLGGCTCSSDGPSTPVDLPPPPDDRYAAEMILLDYDGVKYLGDGEAPERSKEEALALAERLVKEARDAPDRFAGLAREHSDVTREIGSFTESWKKGEGGDFDAVEALPFGGISDPIDSVFGILVLKRVEPLPRILLSGRRLTVAWQGAERAPKGVTRTREEAEVRAVRLQAQAAASPTSFEALVREESDGWDTATGGFMGTWTAETRRYPLVVEHALADVDVGAVTHPVETRFGYQIFKRIEPDPGAVQVAGRHILVSHAEAQSSRSDRSKAEARARAEEVAAKAKADPSAFPQLAVEYSDDGSRERGGHLGAWNVGTRLPMVLDEGFLKLGFGEVSGAIESPYGFHVLQREKAPADKSEEYRNPLGGVMEDADPPEGATTAAPDEHDHAGHEGHDH